MFLRDDRAVGKGIAGLALLFLLPASAVLVRNNDWYRAGTDFGYDLGLVGGILMLLLLIYPVKKRVKIFQRMGSTKPWFIFHMICGVGGPLAIIFHSGFRIESQNALVAMLSMLLVAGSGIVGRFIYVRIHHGLSEHELKLDELEGDEHSNALNFNRDMHWAPDVLTALTEFRTLANQPAASYIAGIWKFCRLPIDEWQVRRHCHTRLTVHLDNRGTVRKWDLGKRKLRGKQFDALVARYTTTVMRRSQLNFYKRLFAWWHILHLPFVYLLAASGIYHVVAVHMY